MLVSTNTGAHRVSISTTRLSLGLLQAVLKQVVPTAVVPPEPPSRTNRVLALVPQLSQSGGFFYPVKLIPWKEPR